MDPWILKYQELTANVTATNQAECLDAVMNGSEGSLHAENS